jgi:hypothetical protein
MTPQVPTSSEPGIATLVTGIVEDIGDLIKQEFKFARTEVQTDLRKSKEAIVALAIGAGAAALGAIFAGLMVVHLLHWLTSPPATDPASIPLWGCYGIVTLVFLGSGMALLLAGKKKFDSFNPLPEQTVATVKENVQWIANSK